MFIKKLDMLSPPITLYFKGEGSHVSYFSGLLSIVVYILVFAATIYYALEFINRESPKAYFFTRYVEDAGTFPVNSTQMFHFFQVSNPKDNEKVPLDLDAFRIVGFDDAYSDDFLDDNDLAEKKNHWLYGYCNNDSDTRGIAYLMDQKYYEQSACIRKYYDAQKAVYFTPGEEGFRWPIIEKGCSNPKRTYYGIIMQRCDKAGTFLKSQGNCKTTAEIDDIVDHISLNFQIVDHYADMLNYEMPLTKYIYEVTSDIKQNHFIIQHLNFNPANMLTHNGFFFDNQVREAAYFFTQNEKQTVMESDKPTHGCLIGVYFWMQNTLQYYERNYDRIQDILSDIGGISSIVLTIASILNLLVHNFIVILDTEELALNSEQENYTKDPKEMARRPTIFRKANKIMSPPPRRPYQARKQYGNDSQQQQSSNYQRLMKDGVDIYPNMNSNEEKTEQYKNLYLKRAINNEANKEGSYMNENLQNHRGYTRKGNQNYTRGNYYQQGTNSQIKETYSKSIKDDTTFEKKEEEDEGRPLEKQNFNWFKYLKYLISCGKTEKNIAYYEEFRAKLISEENIIQNYMDVYKLLKACNIKKPVFNKHEK